jgi:hypothetical protein
MRFILVNGKTRGSLSSMRCAVSRSEPSFGNPEERTWVGQHRDSPPGEIISVSAGATIPK